MIETPPIGGELAQLRARTDEEQQSAGYRDTLREILQQPETWLQTEQLVRSVAPAIPDDARAVVLTGSGSSEYAGACVAASLQRELGIPVTAIGGGAILADPRACIPPLRPCLLVSLARSGNSPESTGVVDLLRETEPEICHLAITCNPEGRLANVPDIGILLLSEQTNDRSLVMTSSVTNLVVASRLLGRLETGVVSGWAAAAHRLFSTYADSIARAARTGFNRAVYLGTGDLLGAAREGALKMLEMTAGRVMTMAESWLGVRHGPMSAIDCQTLIVGFVSSSEPARSFELDVLADLTRKRLGTAKIIVGESVPHRPPDTIIIAPGAPVIAVVVAQLLAFFRCLAEGLNPDAPSPEGVITRVVENFSIHRGGKS